MKKYFFWIALIFLGLTAGSSTASGQEIYSYVDEDGVKVFTNIPPKKSIHDVTAVEVPPVEIDAVVEAPAIAPATRIKTVDNFASLDFIHDLIDKYAEENDLDPHLIRSIIDTESGFNHRAVSRSGALGLMQLMPATARSLGVQNSFDPEENIRGGVRYFRSLMDRFDNNLDLSLAAYNAGEGLVGRLGRVPDYRETREYVASVKKKYGLGERGKAPEPSLRSTLYRYIDESGVRHFTNVIP